MQASAISFEEVCSVIEDMHEHKRVPAGDGVLVIGVHPSYGEIAVLNSPSGNDLLIK